MPHTTSLNEGGWALFLDVDGTLLEIAETPQDVQVPDSLKQLLQDLELRLHGALALISGRSLSNLDQLFSPLRLCASGTHGCERRDINGALTVPAIDATRLAAARAELHHFVNQHPGLILEDKHYGLAMHFRRAPQFGVPVQNKMRAILESLGPDFTLQAGKCVFELRPAAWNKGVSVTTFMQELPFRNRTPIYIGDDVTDEDAFAAVNAMQGMSIRVGETIDSYARHRLRGVSEVLRWLQVNPPAPFVPAGLAP